MTTSTRTERLVQMANQIGVFFEAMPDEDEALEGIAEHIRRYWAPDMRKELLEVVSLQGSGGLTAVVNRSLEKHRGVLMPSSAASR